MLNKKFFYVLSCFKINKTAYKNNPRTHSPQQNKKALLTTASYFKACTSLRLQRQKLKIIFIFCVEISRSRTN